jgi:Tol biopolymer transport system component
MLLRLKKVQLMIALILSSLLIYLFACTGAQVNRSGGGFSSSKKVGTIYIYEVLENKAAQERMGNIVGKGKGIASDSIIEESPNVKGVMRCTDFKGERAIHYPSVSPDGSFVVFSIYDEKSKGINLWKKSVSGGGMTRLTKGTFVDIYPVVSRDGKSVYFSSNRSGTFNIWRISIAGGGGITRITTHRNRDFAPDPSYDGTKLLFHSYTPGDDQPQIWTCRTDGTQLTQLRVGYRPKWHKSDKKILFLGPIEKQRGVRADFSYDLWEMNVDGTMTTQLSTGGGVVNACYGNDGRIIYSRINKSTKKPNYDIWIGRTQVTTNLSDDDFPMIDDQGKLYFRSSRGKSYDYWVTEPIL